MSLSGNLTAATYADLSRSYALESPSLDEVLRHLVDEIWGNSKTTLPLEFQTLGNALITQLELLRDQGARIETTSNRIDQTTTETLVTVQKLVARADRPDLFFNVPSPPAHQIVGRDELLAELKFRLLSRDRLAISADGQAGIVERKERQSTADDSGRLYESGAGGQAVRR